MRYRIEKVSGETYIDADRDALQVSGAVIFLNERKTPAGSAILLPESQKDKREFDTVLVLGPYQYILYEPLPNA